jgi:hypothetical protein
LFIVHRKNSSRVKRAVEELATNPKVAGAGKKLTRLGGLPLRQVSTAKQVYDVMTGKQDIGSAAVDAVRNEVGQQVVQRAPGLLQRIALKVAPRLAGASGIFGGGALLGTAIPAGLLAAIEHDSKRDFSGVENTNTLAGSIARALSPRPKASVSTSEEFRLTPEMEETLRKAAVLKHLR